MTRHARTTLPPLREMTTSPRSFPESIGSNRLKPVASRFTGMNDTNKFISIGGAAKLLGVSVETLRRWESIGKLVPVRTPAGHRRYDTRLLKMPLFEKPTDTRPTVAYARVPSPREELDLKRQAQLLENYCAQKGWEFELVSEIGSGANDGNTGLKRLLDDIIGGRIARLVLTHKDCLFRIGADLIFTICEIRQVEVVILNRNGHPPNKDALETEMRELLTLFSSRPTGRPASLNQNSSDETRPPARESSEPALS